MSTPEKNIYILNSEDFKNNAKSKETIRTFFASDALVANIAVIEDVTAVPNSKDSEIVVVGNFNKSREIKSLSQLSQCPVTWIGMVEDGDLPEKDLESTAARRRSSSGTLVETIIEGNNSESWPDRLIIALNTWTGDYSAPGAVDGANGRKLYACRKIVDNVMVSPDSPEKVTSFAKPSENKIQSVFPASNRHSLFSTKVSKQISHYTTAGILACFLGLTCREILNCHFKDLSLNKEVNTGCFAVATVTFLFLTGLGDLLINFLAGSKEDLSQVSKNSCKM